MTPFLSVWLQLEVVSSEDPTESKHQTLVYKFQVKINLTYFAIQTNPLFAFRLHLLAHCFGDVDAFSVVPFLARVAANHKAIVVRLIADAP